MLYLYEVVSITTSKMGLKGKDPQYGQIEEITENSLAFKTNI